MLARLVSTLDPAVYGKRHPMKAQTEFQKIGHPYSKP